MLWQGCYRNPAKKGTFLSSYQGDILMEFRQLENRTCQARGATLISVLF